MKSISDKTSVTVTEVLDEFEMSLTIKTKDVH